MIKKIIWSVVFIVMGTVGAMAGFGIANVWDALHNWWTDAMHPIISLNWDEIEAGDWFSLIGGTLWAVVLVAPAWYLWKGTDIFTPDGIFGLILRILIIVVLYFAPTIYGAIDNSDGSVHQTVDAVFTWIIIGLALLGLWLKS